MSNSLLNDQKINKLINEIKSRPPLYNKKLKEYLDNNLKKKLWLQIYRAVWKDWDSKTGEQKLEAALSFKIIAMVDGDTEYSAANGLLDSPATSF